MSPPSPSRIQGADDPYDFDTDFDVEEVALIEGFLRQANSQLASPALAVVDADDYAGAHPNSVILPRSSAQGRRYGASGSSAYGAVAAAAAGLPVPAIEIQYDGEDWAAGDFSGRSSILLPAASSWMLQSSTYLTNVLNS